jgi:O-antigen/teichoic acid export membrane protein
VFKQFIFLTKFDTVTNFLKLFSGTIISQIIALISIPFLSRYFDEVDHGIYGNYITILSYFSIIVTLRYELGIVFAKSNKSVNYLIIICILISFFISILSAIMIFLFNYYSLSYFNWEHLNEIFYFLPFSIFFNGIIQTFVNFYNRKKYYIELSKVRLVLSIFTNALPFVIYFLFSKEDILIISYFIAQLIVVILIVVFNYKLILESIIGYNHRFFIAVFSRYRKLAIYNAPSSLIDQLASSIPIIFIGYKFGIASSGVYLMATKIISLPSAILTVPISQIFFQQVSESHIHSKSTKPIFVKAAIILLIISIAFYTIVFIHGEEIFRVFLGNNWSNSGKIASILAISNFIKFVVSPLSLILTAIEKLRTLALWQLLSLICTVVLILINWHSLEEYLYMLVLVDVFLYLIYFIIIYLNVK